METTEIGKETLILTLRAMIPGADELEQVALMAAIQLMEAVDSDGIEIVLDGEDLH